MEHHRPRLESFLGLGLLSLTVGGAAHAVGSLGLVPLMTGIVGFCPLYRMVGLSTCSAPLPKGPITQS